MRRRLVFGAVVIAAVITGRGVRISGAPSAFHPPVLQRFLTEEHSTLVQYRALRHIEARNDRMGARAWMDVWTEADESGFRYTVVGQGGSSFVRSHVFDNALETERDMWQQGAATRASISAANYEFEQCEELDGIAADLAAHPELTAAACIGLKPRRKDVLLVDGSIFLRTDNSDLLGISGSLSKSPSFWTRRVDISRRYARVGGVRVPVALESVASLRFAGNSTLAMTYEYESVNGHVVGNPHVVERTEAANRNSDLPGR